MIIEIKTVSSDTNSALTKLIAQEDFKANNTWTYELGGNRRVEKNAW
jgi:hypothetical protein